MEAPTPTRDLDQAGQDLDRAGIAIVPDAISGRLAAAVLYELTRIAGEERDQGTALLEDGAAADGNYSPGPNQRVLSLLEKGTRIAELACHHVPLAMSRQRFDGRTQHRTGSNTTDEPRPVVLVTYCPPWVRPFDDNIARSSQTVLPTRPWFVYDQPSTTGGDHLLPAADDAV
jgi:hypothetical protein